MPHMAHNTLSYTPTPHDIHGGTHMVALTAAMLTRTITQVSNCMLSHSTMHSMLLTGASAILWRFINHDSPAYKGRLGRHSD